jgi:alpha-ketoglutarate-dependent taurine dioxygenase
LTIVIMNASNSFGLDAVNIALFPSDDGSGNKALPLVITPRWNSSKNFLVDWCSTNRAWLDTKLVTYGAILLRGFCLDTPADMEETIRSYHHDLSNTYRGTSPRHVMEGTDYVFSAAEVPVNYPIAQHIEMSFLDTPPRQLFFGCIKQANSAGGETSLADFRQVYRDIPSDLKQKLIDKGVRYQRTHKKVGSYYTYDVSDMLGWPELFGTSDKKQVEQMCAAEGISVEWKGDTFVSVSQQDAFQLHPVTKEPVWFNHIQVFHWTTFPAELWIAFWRTHEVRLLMHCFFVAAFCIVKYGLLGHKMGLHATYGDGTPISVKEMQEIRRCIHKNMVFNRWAKGDLVFLDNFSTSHGRQPTYDRNRKIVVAWADPLTKTNEVKSLTMAPVKNKEDSVPVAYSMENPQERTPESTLTHSESQVLKEGLYGSLLSSSLHKSLDEGFDNPRDFKHLQHHSNKKPSFAADANFWEEME